MDTLPYDEEEERFESMNFDNCLLQTRTKNFFLGQLFESFVMLFWGCCLFFPP